jgi:type VI secretion system protein
MREERLLERIRSWKKEPNRRSRGDQARMIDSIVTHLQRILNTRRGNVPIAEDYGVPELTNFLYSYPDSVMEIEESIRQAIEKYEPRLSGIQVEFSPQEDDVSCLRFQINAQLATESGNNVPIGIGTIVDTDGKVHLKC